MYDNPFYIYTSSNHPLVLLKQIPLSVPVNSRLSDMSYEKIFNKIKKQKKKKKFNDKKNTGFPAEQKHSIEKETCFNPPYNKGIKRYS